jgi:hypothetical protein
MNMELPPPHTTYTFVVKVKQVKIMLEETMKA